MAGSRTALFALLILAVFVLADWLFQPGPDTTMQDADLVYCLAPEHQAGLVGAAESLGLAGPGSTPAGVRVAGHPVSLGTWRARNGGDFQRACDAYAAPAFPAGGSPAPASGSSVIGSLLNILLPVAAGAMLALAIDEIKQGASRRWAQADELRAAWGAFRGLIDTYAEGRKKLPSGTLPEKSAIDALRRDLDTMLLTIHSQHRRSPTVKRLRDQLRQQLGDGIAAGWAGGDDPGAPAERAKRAKGIKSELQDFDSSLQAMAGKLERRIWLSSKL
jgi:hypothetical protein